MTPSETKHRSTTEAIPFDSMHTMDAKEWKYEGEGGKHALFSFLPMTPSSSSTLNSSKHQRLQRWQGRLLRISKKDLRMAATAQRPIGLADRPTTRLVDPQKSVTPSRQVKAEGEGTRGGILETIHHALDSLCYVQHFVAPALSETYVDIPQLVALDGIFLDQLRDQTLALDNDTETDQCPRIPQSRRKDWQKRAATQLALEPKIATTTSISSAEETRPTILSSLPQPHEPQLVYGMLLVDYKQWTWNSQPSVISNSESISSNKFSNISSSKKNTTISIEIKPKAGYKAFSPLVDPMHRIKYQETRFSLSQQLYAQGHIQKGWTLQDTVKTRNHDEKKDATTSAGTSTPRTISRPFQVSAYDPMDLFSTVPSRIQAALSNLFSCPQNNLRVWQGDHQVIGLGSSDDENKDDVGLATDSSIHCCPKYLNSKSKTDVQSRSSKCGTGIHPNSDYSKDFLAQILPGIIASILYQERLLPRLLQLQRLDILDADGAILVYHRLVELYGGSHEDAERALDDYTTYSSSRNSYGATPKVAVNDESPSGISSLPPDLLSASPFPLLGLKSGMVNSLCLEIQRFRNLMEGEGINNEDSSFSEPRQLPSEEDMTRIRKECLRQIELLSTQESIYLLQNWLLSLSMCDVSLFVTLRPGHQKEEPDHEATIPFTTRPGGVVYPPTTSSRTTIVHTADGKNPGLLVYHDVDGSSQTFYYTLKVIDCDNKPAKKLRSREEKESPFRLLQCNQEIVKGPCVTTIE
jgi:hypothetical protein